MDGTSGGADFVVPAGAFSGVLLWLSVVSASSGIVANFLRTCLSAGRRIGLLICISGCHDKISRMPYLRNMSIPESMHSLTLLSSANAVRATIGAE